MENAWVGDSPCPQGAALRRKSVVRLARARVSREGGTGKEGSGAVGLRTALRVRGAQAV